MPTPLARDSDRLFGPQFHMDYVGTSGPDCPGHDLHPTSPEIMKPTPGRHLCYPLCLHVKSGRRNGVLHLP